MPCYDHQGPNKGELQGQVKALKLDLNNYADQLCRSCWIIEQAGLEMPDDIIVWWSAHKASDYRRVLDGLIGATRHSDETLRDEYIAQLSTYEKHLIQKHLDADKKR